MKYSQQQSIKPAVEKIIKIINYNFLHDIYFVKDNHDCVLIIVYERK